MNVDQSNPILPKRWKANFFSFWTGQALSLLGSQLVQFALIWWLTQKTGSATVLATATLIGLLPQIVLSPVAGTLVDRVNRKWVMILADVSIALVTAVLIYLFWQGDTRTWHIYVLMLIRSLAGAFHFPAMTASTSLMVPEHQLTRIAGLNQVLQGVMGIAVPPLGALIIGLMPMHQVLLIDVLTALVGVSIIFFIQVPQPASSLRPVGDTTPQSSFWSDFKAGFAYVRAWPGLMAILILAALINLIINPAYSLIPLLITDHFKGGAMQLGIFESVNGFGMIAGALTLTAWGGFKRRMVTVLSGLIVVGASSIMIGLAPGNAFWLAIIGSGLDGIVNPMTGGTLMAILQVKVAPEMQGRVFTLLMAFSSMATPIGLGLAGTISDLIGVGPWIAIGGVFCCIIGVLLFFVPLIMNLEEQHPAIERAETNPGLTKAG